MEDLISPVPFPLFPPPIGGVGNPGKWEPSRRVPKWEKWEKRELIFSTVLSVRELFS
jgi:hypothetical protein